jgi:hypothetical protein
MKYILSQLPEGYEEGKRSADYYEIRGIKPPLENEDEAVAEAKRTSRKSNADIGVYKLIKKVSPPDVKVEDVE